MRVLSRFIFIMMKREEIVAPSYLPTFWVAMRGADATVVVDTAEAQVDPAEALEEIEAIAEEVIAPEGSRFLVVGGSQVSVKDGAAAAVSHGASLARPGVVRATPEAKVGSLVVIETLKGEAVSVAELTVETEALLEISSGEVAVPKAVLMSPGTYPQTWTKPS